VGSSPLRAGLGWTSSATELCNPRPVDDDPELQRAQAESIGVGLVALVRDGALQNVVAGAGGTQLADEVVSAFDRVVRADAS
jgi:hypothetical protein